MGEQAPIGLTRLARFKKIKSGGFPFNGLNGQTGNRLNPIETAFNRIRVDYITIK
jgi:hypothetical protein